MANWSELFKAEVARLVPAVPLDVSSIWQPHAGPQTAFLKSGAYEVLYGGAAGGGKTDALLYGSLDQVHLPGCRVLFLRRTYPELREVMDRALGAFTRLGATWNSAEKRWTFPSGATYEFGYCIEGHTEVRMGDGSLKPMLAIRAGDMVMTLEGPRRVTRHWYVGKRRAVSIRVDGVETIASESHEILGADGTWAKPCELVHVARDGENVRREASQNSRGIWQPPVWFAPVMLHAPVRPLLETWVRDTGYCGVAAHGQIPLGLPDSQAGCHRVFHSGGALVLRPSGSGQVCTQPQGDADIHGRTESPQGGQASTQGCSPSGGVSYYHPYTRERRIASEGVRPSWAEITPAGEHALWDMSVEEVNQYITKSGLVHKNCETYSDVMRYQGQEYTVICYDELGQCSEERIWTYLMSRNRSTDGRLVKRMRASANPGGPGHVWLKRRFIDRCAPDGSPILHTDGGDLSRAFVAARLADNPTLNANDPSYRARLAQLPEVTRRQLLDGDWSAGEGLALSELNREVHLVSRCEVPAGWYQWGSFDWGFNHPYVAGWYASDPDGNVYLVDSLQGRRQLPHEIAERILEQLPVGLFRKFHAGHDCWNEQRARGENTPSIADQFLKEGIRLQKANISRVTGLNNFRAYLTYDKLDPVHKPPRFRIMDTPANRRVFETLEGIVTDPNRPEDALKVDADDYGAGGDDAYDMVRYGLAARPLHGKAPDDGVEMSAFSPEALAHDVELRKISVRRALQKKARKQLNSWEGL